MAKSDYKRDIQKLIKMVRKVGKKVADKGTYVERPGKHLLIKFDIGSGTFRKSYSSSPSSYSAVKKAYAQTRRQLLALGIKDTRFSVRMSTGVDEWDGLFGSIHSLLDSVIPHRDETSPAVGLYFDDVDKLHPTRTKPYKKKVAYVSKKGRRKGKKITYDLYYVFGRKLDRFGRLGDGFISVREPVFREAVIMWNKVERRK